MPRSFNTDNKTYVNGLRYRIAIKFSTKYREYFGPMIGQRGLLIVEADGAYINVDRVNEYAKELAATPLYEGRSLQAHNKAHERAVCALNFVIGELNRVLREAIAGRRVGKWARSNVVIERMSNQPMLEAAE